MAENYFQDSLRPILLDAFKQGFGMTLEAAELHFETPPKPEYGQIAFPCFPFAKALRKSPTVIATALAENISLGDGIKITAQGAYLNFLFSVRLIYLHLFRRFAQTEPCIPYGKSNLGAGKKILIEFSAPNANKPLHLGHARNQSIGLFLSRSLKYLGFEVKTTNLINDRGVHICKSMLAYALDPNPKTPSANRKGDHLVGDYYVQFDKLSKQNPALEQEAQNYLKRWEEGDPEILALWRKMTDWVLEGIEATYKRSGIKFDQTYYESETYQGGKDLVLQALQDGLVEKTEDGAVRMVFPEEDGIEPKILLRRDGTSVYMTQDLNTTAKKYADFPFDEAWWVVGNEQEHHFRVLFALLHGLQIVPPGAQLKHISYGMVELPDGKMKSREGTTVDLDRLYDDQQQAAAAILKERIQAEVREPSALKDIAEKVGQASIHFYLLKTAAHKNILFDPEESLKFDGMTGPYLQYTYARISSLLRLAGVGSHEASPIGSYSAEMVAVFQQLDSVRNPNYPEQAAKAQVDFELFEFFTNSDFQPEREEEILLHLMVAFPTWIEQAALECNPSILCHSIYDLARQYNKCYALYPVLNANNNTMKDFRISLSIMAKHLLKRAFHLMNITPLESM